MALRVAIQMDDPATLNAAGDSTVALALEAQARGCVLYCYHPASLCLQGGDLTALAAPITFFDDAAHWYEAGEAALLSLNAMDAVLMRQDPPFDMTYLSATFLLERLPPAVRVLNPPAYVRNHPEKLAILDFPDAIPPTLVTADEAAIAAFQAEHGRIVVKPLYGFGGRSVYVFAPGDSNLRTFLEQHREQHGEPLMIQRFLPEVAERDVRVILMNGRISAAVGRIPASGDIRANFRVGGTAARVELNPRQRAICETVGARLREHGVLFAGLDLIGEYLTEINITSPTGIRAAQRLYGCNPAADFWDAVQAAP